MTTKLVTITATINARGGVERVAIQRQGFDDGEPRGIDERAEFYAGLVAIENAAREELHRSVQRNGCVPEVERSYRHG